jgi:hypothetical protein
LSLRLTGVFLIAAFFGAGAGLASSELSLSAVASLAVVARFAATLGLGSAAFFVVAAFFAAAFFGGILVQKWKSDSCS